MTMTSHEHVEQIAQVVRHARICAQTKPAVVDAALQSLARDLATIYAGDNPRFNYVRFMDACAPEGGKDQ